MLDTKNSIKITALLGTLFVLSFSFDAIKPAEATAAFARDTGASCNKCHTASFPRLTVKGERFMRNGFQLKKKQDDGFSLDDDVPQAGRKSPVKKDIGEMLSVTGRLTVLAQNSEKDEPILAKVNSLSLLATTTLAENIPFWAGIEVEGNSASLHKFFIGRTNINDSTYFNVRAGTLDPTTWTSFYSHGAALDSASPGIGAYGAGHHGDANGFSTVGAGMSEKNALEYYGYNDLMIWSVGVGNEAADDGHSDGGSDAGHEQHASEEDKSDYWVTGKFYIGKKHSVSLLWYNANGLVENQTFIGAANYRTRKLDLRGQIAFDNTGAGNRDDKMGATLQADYRVNRRFQAIGRYDMTDNGQSSNNIEAQLTLAAVYKPKQNIKVTTSFVTELDAATELASDGHDHEHETSSASSVNLGDQFNVEVRVMF